MNFLNKYYIIFLLVAVFLTSCNPENLDEITPQDPNFTPIETNEVYGLSSAVSLFSNLLGIELDSSGCITLLFPFDVEQSDGTVVTVEDQDQYDVLEATGDSLTLLIPFSLYTAVDSMTVVVNTPEEIIEPLSVCGILGIGGPNAPCAVAHITLFFSAYNIFNVYQCPFDINYPVEMFVNGSATATSIGDLNEYFSTSGAPGDIQDVELVYPIIVTQDGVDITLNSDQEVCDFIDGC